MCIHIYLDMYIYIYMLPPPLKDLCLFLLFAVLLRLRQSTNNVRPRATADVHIYATPP